MKYTERINVVEILRFSIIGGCSVFVYTLALLFLKDEIGLINASLVAYLLTLFVNYLFQKNWTFKSERKHINTMPRFIVIHIFGIIINSSVLYVFIFIFDLLLIISQLVAFMVVAIWSYSLQKLWVFESEATFQR